MCSHYHKHFSNLVDYIEVSTCCKELNQKFKLEKTYELHAVHIMLIFIKM